MTEIIPGLQMSFLEILLVVGAAALVLVVSIRTGGRTTSARRPITFVAAAAAVVVLSGVALGVTGLRWQFVPVLVAAALVFPFAVARFNPDRMLPWTRWWLALPGTLACAGLVAAGPASAWALPAPVFPQPTGDFAVGTSVMEWTDADRPETATPERDDRRTVVVQLWYPGREPASSFQSGPAAELRALYLGRTLSEARIVADALGRYAGIPSPLRFLLDGPVRARTHAVADAPVAAAGGRFPVVLFSPGSGGLRTQNTAWAEELASHGYVVVALDHPYDSAVVVLDDGQVIRTALATTGDRDQDRELVAGWVATRTADLRFALTQVERLDRGEIDGPLTGRLDTGRVAATGHSLGGAAALQAAHQDARFAAVIDVDGYPHGPVPSSVDQPVLAFTQAIGPDSGSPDYIPRLTEVLDLSTRPSYRLTVPGAAHLTFTDAPLFLPPVPAIVGSLGRTEGVRVTAAASVTFLDATLRDDPGDVAETLATYGDLRVHQRE